MSTWVTLAALVGSLTLQSLPADGQRCDDTNECTTNDMCSEGLCEGSPVSGSCDDGNPCTIDELCSFGVCFGSSPAPEGTECSNGCGSCIAGTCLANPAKDGQQCDDGQLCTNDDACRFGQCFGRYRECPDSDGNPCTLDFCNPLTGQCEAAPHSSCGDCQTCEIVNEEAVCGPAPDGGPCEDFNQCTAVSLCAHGECVGRPDITPEQATPTVTPTPPATQTQVAATPSPTSAPTCAGDCGADGVVSIDELIIAVNIALDALSVDRCRAADSNHDAQVTVEEIVSAVNRALTGCEMTALHLLFSAALG